MTGPSQSEEVAGLAKDLRHHLALLRSVGLKRFEPLGETNPVEAGAAESPVGRAPAVRPPEPAPPTQAPAARRPARAPQPSAPASPPPQLRAAEGTALAPLPTEAPPAAAVLPTEAPPAAAALPTEIPTPEESAAPSPAPAPQVPAVQETSAQVSSTESSASQLLAALRADIGDCTRCPLHEQGRSQIVFGVGNPEAEVMFVGEAPGRDEDRIGEPFVGAAGKLLTAIIESGMKLKREEVYIANIIKCRPPRNRDPLPVEVDTCRPFVLEQIRIVQPRVIVVLGRVAAQALLGVTTSISRLRGTWTEIDGVPVMPTFHPAYLLRNPEGKRPVWSDVKAVNRFLSEASVER